MTTDPPTTNGRMITVCSNCLRASCWHGNFMCDDAKNAGTVEKSEYDLADLNLEHHSHYSEERIKEVCG